MKTEVLSNLSKISSVRESLTPQETCRALQIDEKTYLVYCQMLDLASDLDKAGDPKPILPKRRTTTPPKKKRKVVPASKLKSHKGKKRTVTPGVSEAIVNLVTKPMGHNDIHAALKKAGYKGTLHAAKQAVVKLAKTGRISRLEPGKFGPAAEGENPGYMTCYVCGERIETPLEELNQAISDGKVRSGTRPAQFRHADCKWSGEGPDHRKTANRANQAILKETKWADTCNTAKWRASSTKGKSRCLVETKELPRPK